MIMIAIGLILALFILRFIANALDETDYTKPIRQPNLQRKPKKWEW